MKKYKYIENFEKFRYFFEKEMPKFQESWEETSIEDFKK